MYLWYLRLSWKIRKFHSPLAMLDCLRTREALAVAWFEAKSNKANDIDWKAVPNLYQPHICEHPPVSCSWALLPSSPQWTVVVHFGRWSTSLVLLAALHSQSGASPSWTYYQPSPRKNWHIIHTNHKNTNKKTDLTAVQQPVALDLHHYTKESRPGYHQNLAVPPANWICSEGVMDPQGTVGAHTWKRSTLIFPTTLGEAMISGQYQASLITGILWRVWKEPASARCYYRFQSKS